MNENEILKEVKKGIKELSDYNDEEIMLWVKASINYLVNAGVSRSKIESGEALGVITLIVQKLRYSETNFGEIVNWMVAQLALSGD